MSAPLGPASREPYGGSRREKERYQYSASSRAGFAELSPDWVMTGSQLFEALKQVVGVERVGWQTPKYAQGNPSASRCAQQNVLVYSSLRGSNTANQSIEF